MLRLRSLLCGSSFSLAIALGLTAEARCQTPGGDVVNGQELFEHEWTKDDPRCPTGDGLGPVFNARSCKACHFQGRVGGAGAGIGKGTVDVIRLSKEPQPPKARGGKVEALPDFAADWGRLATDNPRIRGGTLLHLSSLDANYRDWRIKLLMGNPIPPAPDGGPPAEEQDASLTKPLQFAYGGEFVIA